MSRTSPEALLASSPLRAILRLAAPTTFVMLVSTTTNVLFTYYVSRLGSEAIAAVALVFPVSLLAITAMGGGLGSGAASAIARALGGGRRTEAANLAGHAIILAVGVGIAFGAAILVGGSALFALLGGRGHVHALAVTFGRVLFGGAVITFTAAMLDSVLRGEGNTRVPATWSTVSLVLQMILTPMFMFVFGWGFVGAPIAMLTAQSTGIVPRAWFLRRGGGVVTPTLTPPHAAPLGEILRVGVPAALSTALANVGLMALTSVMARHGDADLAAYGLATRFDFLLLSFAYGFGAAALTLVGMAAGAHRPDRVRAFVRRTSALTVSLIALPSAILWWRPEAWVGLFTEDAAILAVGHAYFRVVAPSYPFLAFSMVLSFTFQGLGKATLPLLWMTFRVAVITTFAIWATRTGYGEHVIFVALAAANVVSAGVMGCLYLWAQHGRASTERPDQP